MFAFAIVDARHIYTKIVLLYTAETLILVKNCNNFKENLVEMIRISSKLANFLITLGFCIIYCPLSLSYPFNRFYDGYSPYWQSGSDYAPSSIFKLFFLQQIIIILFKPIFRITEWDFSIWKWHFSPTKLQHSSSWASLGK